MGDKQDRHTVILTDVNQEVEYPHASGSIEHADQFVCNQYFHI